MEAPTVIKLGHVPPQELKHVSIFDPNYHLPHPDPPNNGAHCCTAGIGEGRCMNIRMFDAMVDKENTNAAYSTRRQIDRYLAVILDKNSFDRGMMLYFLLDSWVKGNLCQLHCKPELKRAIIDEKLWEICYALQETGMFDKEMVSSRVGEGIYAIANPAFGKYDANAKDTVKANALVVYKGPYKTKPQAPKAPQLKNVSVFAADYHLPHPEESGTYCCTAGIGGDRCMDIRSLDADKETRAPDWRKHIDSFLPQLLDKDSFDLGMLLYPSSMSGSAPTFILGTKF